MHKGALGYETATLTLKLPSLNPEPRPNLELLNPKP